jgi:thioredoxin reductase (NADPH)
VEVAVVETPDLQGAFPRLTDAQLATIAARTERRPTRAGDVLYREGDAAYDFYVVGAGMVAIVSDYGTADESGFAVHGPGRFLGELSLITGQAALFTAVVREPGEVFVGPAEKLRRLVTQDAALGDIVLRAFLLRRELLIDAGVGLRIVGSRYSPDTRRLRDLCARNRVPHRWLDLEVDPSAEELIRRLGVTPEETPVVISADRVLRNPTNAELAAVVGLRHVSGAPSVDLVVVGAGPAGLAAAVYGASEGLSTVIVDGVAAGGQAATSARIENYLGFPAGISGAELAERAVIQAEKFGAKLTVSAEAATLEAHDGGYVVALDDGAEVAARTVVIATGARYRKLEVPQLDEFEATSIYYAATQMEAQMCVGDPVVVVGGGNSAGQAAVFLSRHAVNVHLLIRGSDLGKDMSRYLVDQVEDNPGVTVLRNTEVREFVGERGELQSLVVENNQTHERSSLPCRALFVFIGAEPYTRWLGDAIAFDEHGFILTGTAVPEGEREPLLFETNLAGVFAVGDVRCGSIKRVASAVGEGSMAVRLVHEHLAR